MSPEELDALYREQPIVALYESTRAELARERVTSQQLREALAAYRTMDFDAQLHRPAEDPDKDPDECEECESLWPCYAERARLLLAAVSLPEDQENHE